MSHTKGGRWGYLGGLLGGLLGGFTWVVIAGIIIGDATIWVAGVLAAAAIGWSSWRMILRYPTKPMAVAGCTILAICLLDLAFLAWILPQLPVDSGSLWLGTNRRAYEALRPLAMIGSASGGIVTAWALWRYRSKGSKGVV